jgi:ribosomal protein S18 acetylase RimI-like enzyme
MPEFRIITLSPTDWQRYREIRLEALQTDQPAFAVSYETAFQRPPEFWQERLAAAAQGEKSWLLFAQAADPIDGPIIGLVGAFLSEDETFAEIVQVYVSPAWRGKGVARALMAAILDVLRQKGICTAVLTVNVQQSAAIALYKQSGFQVSGQADGMMGDGKSYSGYRMERRIIVTL